MTNRFPSNAPRQPARGTQQGAALVLALVFLVILTMLAVSNMREAALDTRITGNLVNEKRCFNAAEAGLRDAEYRLAGAISSKTPGQYPTIPVAVYGEDIITLSRPDATSSCAAGLDVADVCVLDQDPEFGISFDDGAKAYAPDGETEFAEDIMWYALPYFAGAARGEAEVPEYGAVAASSSDVRHEINVVAEDEGCTTSLRSTVLRVYF